VGKEILTAGEDRAFEPKAIVLHRVPNADRAIRVVLGQYYDLDCWFLRLAIRSSVRSLGHRDYPAGQSLYAGTESGYPMRDSVDHFATGIREESLDVAEQCGPPKSTP
jgi:hypothetical protein